MEKTVLRVWKTWKTRGISFCRICKHPVYVLHSLSNSKSKLVLSRLKQYTTLSSERTARYDVGREWGRLSHAADETQTLTLLYTATASEVSIRVQAFCVT